MPPIKEEEERERNMSRNLDGLESGIPSAIDAIDQSAMAATDFKASGSSKGQQNVGIISGDLERAEIEKEE